MMTTEEFIKDQKLSKEKDKKIIDLFLKKKVPNMKNLLKSIENKVI